MKLKQNSAVTSIVCVVILCILIFFVFRPLLISLNSVNIDLSTKKTELSQKETKLESLQNMKSTIASYKETLTVMNKALPKGVDLSSFLVSTEALVGSSGLSLGNLTPPGVSNQSSASTSAPATTTGSVSAGEEEAATTPTTAISPAVTKATGVASTSYTLSLAGSYGAFLTFLDNVNKNIQPTVINSVQLSGSGNNLSINVTMSAYYQK